MTDPRQVNGWTLLFHPAFLKQLQALTGAVEKARRKDPEGYRKKASARRLAAIRKLVFEVIPNDPADPAFRQGKTLGPARAHWFRAKFLQRYRLFFRYDSAAKIIIFAWVNDEATQRTAGATSDPYAVFTRMLERGNPPDDWAALVKAARRADD